MNIKRSQLVTKGYLPKSFKLDDSKVIDIQQKYSTGNFCLHELAKEYGVGTMTIHRVVHNKYWSAA